MERRPQILRVALIQGGKLAQERQLPAGQPVTVGREPGNTFVLPGTSLPGSLTVFEHREERYHLLFEQNAQGRVTLGGQERELSSLAHQGLALRRGELFDLPLEDCPKGKLKLNEITLLFQLTAGKPAKAPRPAPDPLQGGFWRTVDRTFFVILAASLAVHLGLILWVALSPKPSDPDLTIEQLPDRYARLLIPQKPPEPPKRRAPRPPPPKEAPRPEALPADPVARKVAIQKRIASKGLLKVLGSAGPAGALQDVLGDSSSASDIAEAIRGAAGVAVADADSVSGPRGGNSGRAAGIGDLGTRGGGRVDLGPKHAAAITGQVQEQAPDVDSADVDRDALARFVKARLRAIQTCYERELKRTPTLKGRILVRFSITPAGRAGGIDVSDNTVDEEVGSCIRDLIRGWVFPFHPADEVPVAYPLVFAPAS